MSIIFSITVDFDDGPTSNTTNATAPVETFNVLLSRTWPLEDQKVENITSDNSTLWDSAIFFAKESLLKLDDLEENVPSLPVDSPSYRHQTVTSTSKRAMELSRVGYMEECGTKYMYR